MATLPVKTPTGRYEIIIQRGILDDISAQVDITCPHVVVTNTTLAGLYQTKLKTALPQATWVVLPDGERYKTLDTLRSVYPQFLAAGLDRSGVVIAFGGGVIIDLAGFAAATFMRGVRFVPVPTSLLAMVDASVGGKVGVDLPEGKNLVGAFKQPERVLIDPNVLQTLPEAEYQNGMAEVIKHHLIANFGVPLSVFMQDLEQAIAQAVQVKVNIVEQDPFERGIRMYLNLGHTFAHAIEQVSQYRIPHGRAVGVGLRLAAELSFQEGWCHRNLVDQVTGWVRDAGLPTHLNGLDAHHLYAAMFRDKKKTANTLRFVLLKDIGQPVIVEGVDKSSVIQVWETLHDAAVSSTRTKP
ncbi:MAG: 3-dehydroquinate synthase [Gemmatimonadetes bacterium]|nr:MAG: 3-dehydroquinate synthase [Gemmatimonadota bacterium]